MVLEEPVPHSWLLPRCSAVLHHGGSGTTAACLRAGVTQVRQKQDKGTRRGILCS